MRHAHHLRDGEDKGSEALQVDLEGAASNRDNIAAQENTLDALAVLAIAHAAKCIILTAQMHAHGVQQLVLRPPDILGPAHTTQNDVELNSCCFTSLLAPL